MKRNLTKSQMIAAQNLAKTWNKKKSDLALTQEKAGHLLGMTQGAVGHYLRGDIGMSVETVERFAKLLRVSPSEIDPRLASLEQSMTDDELALLRGYRQASEPDRLLILQMIERMIARP